MAEQDSTTTPQEQASLAEQGDAQYQTKQDVKRVEQDPRFSFNLEVGFVYMRDGLTGLETSRPFEGTFDQGNYDEMKQELLDKEKALLESEERGDFAGSVLPGLQTKQSRNLYEARDRVTEAYPATAGQSSTSPATELPDPTAGPDADQEQTEATRVTQPGGKQVDATGAEVKQD